MKSVDIRLRRKVAVSRPARGAWVEILPEGMAPADYMRRAPQGARGLKSDFGIKKTSRSGGRAPQGARGLKYFHPCP